MTGLLKKHIQVVLIDLDGTLLNDEKRIGDLDYQMLIKLGEEGLVRVFATGRNLYSVNRVLASDCPLDYLVFSSGAGVLDWKTKKILFESSIPNPEVVLFEGVLKQRNLNFSIQFPIPENHRFYFHRGNPSDTDFEYRNELYREFGLELTGSYPLSYASQFLIFLPNESEIRPVTDLLDGFTAIRATSPIDGKSIWLEIFRQGISKAAGGQFICSRLNLSVAKTLAIGNDYNDLHMLKWASRSFVVSNAPEALKSEYRVCVSNQSNPLNDVITRIIADFR